MKLLIYRILSFLLLPMAILFSIAFMLLIAAAFANPAMFSRLFLVACIAIYTFASLNFLIRGIDGNKLLGKSSKDWLIVNAIVSMIYSILAIIQQFYLVRHPEIVKAFVADAKKNAGSALQLSDVQLIQIVNGLSYFFLVYGIILFIHIILTFQYIKKYSYLFQNEKKLV